MSRATPILDCVNPFATRHVRPGALAYVFPSGESAAVLVDRLATNGWQGEIVGPHGSGKSTLLAALRPVLEAAGRTLVWCELRDGQRQMPVGWRERAARDGPALIVVDGYEQLGRLARWRLTRFRRRHGCGLLTTAHRSLGLPELARTEVTLPTAQQIVAHLQSGGPQLVGPDDVARAVQAHAHNFREALFVLYDLFEQRRRAAR